MESRYIGPYLQLQVIELGVVNCDLPPHELVIDKSVLEQITVLPPGKLTLAVTANVLDLVNASSTLTSLRPHCNIYLHPSCSQTQCSP